MIIAFRLFLYFLFALQMILLFVGIGILGFGVAMISTNDLLIGKTYKIVADKLLANIIQNNITLTEFVIPVGGKILAPQLSEEEKIERRETISMATQFLIRSSFRSISWFAKFYMYFGFSIMITCLMGLLGFALVKTPLMILFGLSNLVTFFVMIDFLVNLPQRIFYVSHQSLVELYSFFRGVKCTICWDEVVTYEKINNAYDQLSNILAVANSVYQCCGATSYLDILRSYNRSHFPLQCCKSKAWMPQCRLKNFKYIVPTCTETINTHLMDSSLLVYNNIVCSILAILFFFLSVCGLGLGTLVMYKQKSGFFDIDFGKLLKRNRTIG